MEWLSQEWLSLNKEWFIPFIGTIIATIISSVISSVTSFVIFRKSKQKKLRGIRAITQTTIEYGIVNIKVNLKECENGTATVDLRYLGSSLVDTPDGHVEYIDTVTADKGVYNNTILYENFEPKEIILNEEKFKEYGNELKYKLIGPENEPLYFVGEVLIRRKLQKKKGLIGLHVPYNAKYMIVQIDISEAPFIQDYKGKARLQTSQKNNSTIMQTFNKLSKTYTITIQNAPQESNMVFEWKND